MRVFATLIFFVSTLLISTISNANNLGTQEALSEVLLVHYGVNPQKNLHGLVRFYLLQNPKLIASGHAFDSFLKELVNPQHAKNLFEGYHKAMQTNGTIPPLTNTQLKGLNQNFDWNKGVDYARYHVYQAQKLLTDYKINGKPEFNRREVLSLARYYLQQQKDLIGSRHALASFVNTLSNSTTRNKLVGSYGKYKSLNGAIPPLSQAELTKLNSSVRWNLGTTGTISSTTNPCHNGCEETNPRALQTTKFGQNTPGGEAILPEREAP